MVAFLARNWGNLASVVGLVFSVLSFVFSKRASKAAKEARDSVLRRSFGDEMSDACRIARDVVNFVQYEQSQLAQLKAGELVDKAGYLLRRWDARLSEDSRERLLKAQKHIQSAHTLLSNKKIEELTPEDRKRLTTSAQRASTIFSEELGEIVKETA